MQILISMQSEKSIKLSALADIREKYGKGSSIRAWCHGRCQAHEAEACTSAPSRPVNPALSVLDQAKATRRVCSCVSQVMASGPGLVEALDALAAIVSSTDAADRISHGMCGDGAGPPAAVPLLRKFRSPAFGPGAGHGQYRLPSRGGTRTTRQMHEPPPAESQHGFSTGRDQAAGPCPIRPDRTCEEAAPGSRLYRPGPFAGTAGSTPQAGNRPGMAGLNRPASGPRATRYRRSDWSEA